MSAPLLQEVDRSFEGAIHAEEARELHPEVPAVQTQFAELEAFHDRLHKITEPGVDTTAPTFVESSKEGFRHLKEATREFGQLEDEGDTVLSQKCMLSREIYVYGSFVLASCPRVRRAEEAAIAPAIRALGEACSPDRRPDEGTQELQYFLNIRDRRSELLALYRSKGGQTRFPRKTMSFEEILRESDRIAAKRDGEPFLPKGVTWREFTREDYEVKGVARK